MKARAKCFHLTERPQKVIYCPAQEAPLITPTDEHTRRKLDPMGRQAGCPGGLFHDNN